LRLLSNHSTKSRVYPNLSEWH